MDPLTQGALGAALPQSISAQWTTRRKSQVVIAGVLGMVGGVAADLDVLISSDTDPLFFLTYHRQFTHSLLFIPFGGLLVAAVLHGLFRRWWQLSFWHTALFCTLGYASHALLDTTTSYGTMLLWPLVETRYSLSIVSVVDPLFTLPLVTLVIMAGTTNKPRFAQAGLVWVILYLGLGGWQHMGARAMAADLAAERGHVPERVVIKPSFGNILVWRSVYEAEGRYFIDAVRPHIARRIFEGTSIPVLNVDMDLPWLESDTQQELDLKRFDHFSAGYSAIDPTNPSRVIDVRYSFVPNEIGALFSIELDPAAAPSDHVRYITHRAEARAQFGRLWRMIAD